MDPDEAASSAKKMLEIVTPCQGWHFEGGEGAPAASTFFLGLFLRANGSEEIFAIYA